MGTDTPLDRIDALVIGAGVVGLACARALAQAGMEVVMAEKATLIGSGVSSRNSEVIHAGLYYPTGSLKARLCGQGRDLLYAYCAERGVAHRRCGKLLVATDDRLDKLQAIAAQAERNGVPGMRWLDAAQAQALEPALHCTAALLSPHSGIVDSHGLMTSLLGDAENAGATLALASPIRRAERLADGWRVWVGHEDEGFQLHARWLINAAGLDAQAVARAMHGFPKEHIPARHLARGHYFSLQGRAPFSRLIYPTPQDGGLGVHLTLDLGGQAKFGPDVEWLTDGGSGDVNKDTPGDALNYQVDASRMAAFATEVRRYWPGLPEGALAPAYSGIRPKLSGPGEPAADFRIDGPAHHGCSGVVQLFGIESPGLTACMAVAQEVLGQVQASGG